MISREASSSSTFSRNAADALAARRPFESSLACAQEPLVVGGLEAELDGVVVDVPDGERDLHRAVLQAEVLVPVASWRRT